MGETEGEWSIYGFPGLLRGSSNVLKVMAAMHHSIMVLESMGWHTTTCLSMEALHQVFCVKSCSDHGHDQLCVNISCLTLSFLKYKMGEHTDCVEAWAPPMAQRERGSKSTTVHAYFVTWLLLPWAHMEAHTKFPEVSCWVGHLILLWCSLPWCYRQRFWIFVT